MFTKPVIVTVNYGDGSSREVNKPNAIEALAYLQSLYNAGHDVSSYMIVGTVVQKDVMQQFGGNEDKH